MRAEGTWLTGVTLGVKVLKPALKPGLPDSESNAYGLQYPISLSPDPFSVLGFFLFEILFLCLHIHVSILFQILSPTRLLQKVEPSLEFPELYSASP